MSRRYRLCEGGPAGAMLAAILLLLGIAILAGCSGATSPAAASPAGAPATPPGAPMRSSIPAVDPESGLPTIPAAALPAEAAGVISAIRAAGPFVYDQDGSTFLNREGLLPAHPKGYYREYTIPTPGSPDRGARRIVLGSNAEMYYTDDHYGSFKRVVP